MYCCWQNMLWMICVLHVIRRRFFRLYLIQFYDFLRYHIGYVTRITGAVNRLIGVAWPLLSFQRWRTKAGGAVWATYQNCWHRSSWPSFCCVTLHYRESFRTVSIYVALLVALLKITLLGFSLILCIYSQFLIFFHTHLLRCTTPPAEKYSMLQKQTTAGWINFPAREYIRKCEGKESHVSTLPSLSALSRVYKESESSKTTNRVENKMWNKSNDDSYVGGSTLDILLWQGRWW